MYVNQYCDQKAWFQALSLFVSRFCSICLYVYIFYKLSLLCSFKMGLDDKEMYQQIFYHRNRSLSVRTDLDLLSKQPWLRRRGLRLCWRGHSPGRPTQRCTRIHSVHPGQRTEACQQKITTSLYNKTISSAKRSKYYLNRDYILFMLAWSRV